MEICNICNGSFSGSPDELVLCKHKEGFVHMGCCTGLCSMDGKPCDHCDDVYFKKSE